MPSKAFRAFKYNLIDVDRLRQSHGLLSGGTQGKKGLGHITRSGIVMLCAAWELYCEQLLREGAQYLTQQLPDPHSLPLSVQKEISKAVKDSRHELRPLHLSGDGWRNVFADHVNTLTTALNTPKSAKLNDYFARLLGIDKLSGSWSLGENQIDAMVSIRGDIAHQGRHADYITIGDLNEQRDQVRLYVVETDNVIAEHLKMVTKKSYKPWNATS